MQPALSLLKICSSFTGSWLYHRKTTEKWAPTSESEPALRAQRFKAVQASGKYPGFKNASWGTESRNGLSPDKTGFPGVSIPWLAQAGTPQEKVIYSQWFNKADSVWGTRSIQTFGTLHGPEQLFDRGFKVRGKCRKKPLKISVRRQENGRFAKWWEQGAFHV